MSLDQSVVRLFPGLPDASRSTFLRTKPHAEPHRGPRLIVHFVRRPRGAGPTSICINMHNARGSPPLLKQLERSRHPAVLVRSSTQETLRFRFSITVDIGKCTVGEFAHICRHERSADAIVVRKPHAEDRGSVCGLEMTRCPARALAEIAFAPEPAFATSFRTSAPWRPQLCGREDTKRCSALGAKTRLVTAHPIKWHPCLQTAALNR